jgi:hypothetical protein
LDDKWQTADDEWQMADDKWRMADDEWQMASDECRVAEDGCEMRSGGCGDGERSKPTQGVSQGPIVGHDSNRVIDDSTNDKIGILSHEGAHAAGQPGQGDGVGQCLPDDTPKSAKQSQFAIEARPGIART